MTHLTLGQRYEIAIYHSQGKSQSEIGKLLGRDKSTICRELKRNSDCRNKIYKADLANKKAQARHKNKVKNIRFTPIVKHRVIDLLAQDFSPEQIVGHCKVNNLECVSVERIYQYIWKDKKAGGKCHQHLRSKGKPYAKRGALKGSRGHVKARVGIEHRPPAVELRERIGDLEVDLVIGKDHKGALLTINDRATGLLIMDKVESKEAAVVSKKIIELLQRLTPILCTITSDNGKEFANHKAVSEALNISYYFANPYSSWERGSNENLNGLIRQYFPKKYNFEKITQQNIIEVTKNLNNRPRKRYGFRSPNEMFELKLKQTA